MKKNAPLIDEVSEKLFKEFELAVPIQQYAKPRGKKMSEQEIKSRTEAGLQRFYQCAEEERQRHGLGILGRARVAFGLQKRLLAAGYSASLVKQVLVAMLASVFVGGRSK